MTRKNNASALIIFLVMLASIVVPLHAASPGERISFGEVWAYLMNGEESYLARTGSVSDLCYFSAEINAYGELTGVPNISKLANFKGRKHLVVAELGSYSLTHFCLDPAYPIRDRLIAEILLASAPYDGVQIDFEAIPLRDRDNFVTFLAMLKDGLGSKILSVALPARLSDAGDTLGYARIAAIVDRVFIMAYDEHWSTSPPGPVASMEWCSRVARFAASRIEARKLIMGLPFYGRAWGSVMPNRAYKHSGIESLKEEKGVEVLSRENGIPRFRYEENVIVEVYYDDAESLSHRLQLYRNAGIRSVGFWRLGQEDYALWDRIGLYP
ncbi:hypothetical protein MASR2M48_23590 [Spirochaetota bacterium]